MKKSLLTLGIAFSSLYVNAQISLTNATHAPVVGDLTNIVAYDPFTTTLPIPINTGANQTWNFSNIGLDSINMYVHSIIAPPMSAPSGTTATESSASGINRHFKNSTNQLDIRGIETSVGFNYTFNGDFLYRNWPMTYGNTLSDTETGTFTNTNLYYPPYGSFTASHIANAAGYGTLIAPNGVTYSNVLQVIDTTIISMSEIVIDPNTMIYYQLDLIFYSYDFSYYVTSLKYPVIFYSKIILEYISTNLQTNMIESYGTDTTGIFEFNKNPYNPPTGLNLISNEKEFKLYPNPTANSLYIVLNENATIEIYSVEGKLIESRTAQGNYILDVADYQSGVYFVRVIDANGNITQQKFVKQ